VYIYAAAKTVMLPSFPTRRSSDLDVLQDSYLRWADVDLATVRDTKSYLAQLVTRQALNALREGARRREDYIGPWLPEPLLFDERSEEHTSELQSRGHLVCRLLLEK